MATLLKDKSFNKSGSKLIYDFIENLQNEFKERVFKYAEAKLPYLDVGGFEHAFYYGEQQTKTYLTSALDSICDGQVMQEYSVDRKKVVDKTKGADNGYGKLDYWCRYGDNTKITVLLEVKQSWLRYYDKDKYTFYAHSKQLHQQAINQLKNLGNISEMIFDNLYTVALTLLPVFKRYTEHESECDLADPILKKICSDVLKEPSHHATGFFLIPHNLCLIDEWELEDKILLRESHPGFVFLWSIFKNSRK